MGLSPSCTQNISQKKRKINKTIQETTQQAVALKHRGCNCCQAVVGTLAGETDLLEKQLLPLAAGFGAYMGTMEATCGAPVGAGMMTGLKTKGSMTGRVTRQITETFRSLCGAVTCRDLKGISTGWVLCPCDESVYNAVLAYGKSMELSRTAESPGIGQRKEEYDETVLETMAHSRRPGRNSGDPAVCFTAFSPCG